MTNSIRTGFLLVVFAVALAGCDGTRSSSPAAPSPVQPPPTPQPTPGGPADAVAEVTLSGVVFEMTPTGPAQIEGARVFLSDDQDMLTDASGFFSYKPVWVCPCRHHSWLAAGNTIIWVGKDGYDDVPGQPQLPGMRESGWRVVPINGDTRVDIQLVRR